MGNNEKSMLDFIKFKIKLNGLDTITREEFTRIRNTGTPDEIAEAVERMMAAGGYENLE